MRNVVEGVALPYGCDRSALPEPLGQRFVELACDQATVSFVRQALARPHGALRMAGYRLLRTLVSDYDAYGVLGMYPMHLLSEAQFRTLLEGSIGGRLLDVGAGSGRVTAQAAPLFDTVTVTETSRALTRSLRRRGYRLLECDLGLQPLPAGERFDVMLCLNVLDRCLRPRSLLRHLGAGLEPGGRLLVSVPLPLRPHVHIGRHTVDPDEPLPAAAPSWEAGAVSVADEVLAAEGLEVLRLSRAPYLSWGDTERRLHQLDAALFVCALRGAV